MEWAAYHLQHWALFDLLKIAAGFSLLLVGFQFCSEADDRERRWLYDTWSVVDRALDQPVHGGRNAALQDLAQRGFSLAGLRLTTGAWLEEIDLRGADLRGAQMDSARLTGSDLSCLRTGLTKRCTRLAAVQMNGVNLNGGNLSGADLGAAELRGASLVKATLMSTDFTWAEIGNATFYGSDLTAAVFQEAELAGAILTEAKLVGAKLRGADLRGVYLVGADVNGADFSGANLMGANLGGVVNWQQIGSIAGAFIGDVCNAPPGFTQWALARGATLDANSFWAAWEERRPVDKTLAILSPCGRHPTAPVKHPPSLPDSAPV